MSYVKRTTTRYVRVTYQFLKPQSTYLEGRRQRQNAYNNENDENNGGSVQ